jgi:methanogenic corrinoid protein MtbC1
MSPISQQASDAIQRQRAELAAALVEREFARHPELAQRYGAMGREKSLQDAGYHLSFLAQALALETESLFTDYVAWAKVMLAQRRVLASDLAFHLGCLAEIVEEKLPADAGRLAAGYVHAAIEAMPGMREDVPTFLHEDEPLHPLAHQYLEALRRGERQLASRLVLDAVAAGTPVKAIYLHVFQASQREIGRLWQINRISVAEEHYCTAATQLIMSQLYSHIFALEKKDATLVATCVAGDLHELGVRMVADFFEMDGWNTYYLGGNTPHSSVVSTLVERRADVLAISATIPFHVDAVGGLIRAVRQHPACSRVTILAGGYPFNRNPDLWRQVGADGTAPDAQLAIALANRMVGKGGS